MANVEDFPITNDIAVAPGVREVSSEDGAVLLDIEQGICFSLNPVGLKIWELLKQGRSLDRIIDTLEHDFPVPRDQLLSDATEFIAALEAKHLIRRSGQTGAKEPWFSKILPKRKNRLSSH